ncbi:hypothetical protein TNCV_3425851 [Trichonephila clavipes]|nr:hypothetical protein TNCV_3425851 [Trichonephila clavipes]
MITSENTVSYVGLHLTHSEESDHPRSQFELMEFGMITNYIHSELETARAMPIVYRCASFMRCCNSIYSTYCGCSEKGVGIARMGKLPDLDAFGGGQFVGARHMGHSISEIVGQLGFSRSTVSSILRIHGWWTKS